MSDKMKILIKIGLLAHLGGGGANRHIFTFSRNITDLIKKKKKKKIPIFSNACGKCLCQFSFFFLEPFYLIGGLVEQRIL